MKPKVIEFMGVRYLTSDHWCNLYVSDCENCNPDEVVNKETCCTKRPHSKLDVLEWW